MSIDLYAVLGVPRDADIRAIKAAYKAKAKETHPDAGGATEAFRDVQTAFDILSDKERRRKYDATGDVEEEKPDTTRSAALGVIEMTLAAVMGPYLGGGMAPDKDPRWRDVVAEMKAKIRQEMDDARGGIDHGERRLAFLRDMAERFDVAEGENFLRASFVRQIKPNEKIVEGLRQNIVVREMALAVLNGVTFRKADAYAATGGLFLPLGSVFDGGGRMP